MSLYYVIHPFNKKNILFFYPFTWYQSHFSDSLLASPLSVGTSLVDIRTSFIETSLLDLVCRTFSNFSDGSSSVDLLCRIFSDRPSLMDLLQRISFGRPSLLRQPSIRSHQLYRGTPRKFLTMSHCCQHRIRLSTSL